MPVGSASDSELCEIAACVGQICMILLKCNINVAVGAVNSSARQHASRFQIRSYDNVRELARLLHIQKWN